jgi:deoxyribonuclease-4
MLGLHVSILGAIDEAVDRAMERGCTTFQIFTRNPRGWRFKDLDPEDATNFRMKVEANGFKITFSHMPYLPNLASTRYGIYVRSRQSLVAELKRCGQLKMPYLVTHLGSHLGAGKEAGFKRIISAVNCAFSEVENEVTLLLENTAGTKNSMGSSFYDIKTILNGIVEADRVGVCFDTCHAFAAGYDLRTKVNVEATIDEFDRILGLERLKLVHLNDSKGGLNSRIDRHEHIGLGKIGEEGFRNILKSRLGQLPLILETPIDKCRNDLENLETARRLVQ